MKASVEKVLDLADRIERLTGPDRDIDAEIAEHLLGWRRARVAADYDGQNASEVLTPDGRLLDNFSYPPRGKIALYYHVPAHTRDCKDEAFPRNAVRALLVSELRAACPAPAVIATEGDNG